MKEKIEKRIAELTAEKEDLLKGYPDQTSEVIQTMLAEGNVRISMELKFLKELEQDLNGYELPTFYPDIDMPFDEKKKMLDEVMAKTGHMLLLYFRTCKLKSHMESMLIDQGTEPHDKFILSFKLFTGKHDVPGTTGKLTE